MSQNAPLIKEYASFHHEKSVPLLQIHIGDTEQQATKVCDGILDTGSPCTLVPLSIISALNLKNPLSCNRDLTPKAIGGRNISSLAYYVRASFDNLTFFNTKIWACSDQDLEGLAIIGRNIINRYHICFDGPNKKFLIKTNHFILD